MTLTHVSAFSGIGGFDLAMANAGIPTALACEIDPKARGVIADRFPDVHLMTDVKDVTGDLLRSRGLNPQRTIFTAGFPCQDLSHAGNRRGMVKGSGTRSALFWEVDRILAEFHPEWVVLENVPGLLSSRGGRDMGAVLRTLGDRGYGFAYRVLDAQYFGVPQRRRRVVIVGRLGDDGRAPAEVLLEPEGGVGDSASGLTPRPQTAGTVGGSVAACGVLGERSHAMTGEGHDASEDGTGCGTPVVAFHMTQDPISGDVSPALGAPGGGMGVAYAKDVIGALDTMQGGSDDNSAQAGHLVATYQKVVRSGARDAEGNLPPEVWAERGVSATLTPFDLGSESRSSDVVVDGAAGVRRLTPMECERLQGFPDDHTATSGGVSQADRPRYRQLGNAVAVPVFEWVARRLVAVDALRM
jgi:DNA (cytosine-5)-methyltransferase 1